MRTTSKFFRKSKRYKLNRLDSILDSADKDFINFLIHKRSKPGYKIIKSLLPSSFNFLSVKDFLLDFMKECKYTDNFYKMMYFNFKFDLPNGYLVKVDRVSMAHSLETRLPFLDYRLIEFMSGVDKTIKMDGWQTKSILRKTIGKTLPSTLLNSKKKGFSVPVREWFKSPKNIEKIADKFSNSNIFNEKIVNYLLESNLKSESDNGEFLWSLLVLHEFVES